jgi:hypothetical protein
MAYPNQTHFSTFFKIRSKKRQGRGWGCKVRSYYTKEKPQMKFPGLSAFMIFLSNKYP